jgi:hypothetical protein
LRRTRTSWLENEPPQLKLHQTDRSVYSYHSLPNYSTNHASAHSVRADFLKVYLKLVTISSSRYVQVTGCAA